MHATIAGRINNRTDGATLFIPFGHRGFVDEQSGQCHLDRILLPVDSDPDSSPAVEVTADPPAPGHARGEVFEWDETNNVRTYTERVL